MAGSRASLYLSHLLQPMTDITGDFNHERQSGLRASSAARASPLPHGPLRDTVGGFCFLDYTSHGGSREETNCQGLKDTETGFSGVASAITKKDEIRMHQWPGPCFRLPKR